MAVTEASNASADPDSITEMEQLLIEDIRAFCRRCDPLVKRGYHDIIRGNPTAQLLELHRRELQWSLRLARLFRRATSAADFSDRSLARLLEARLRQLEEHWKYIYEPPSQEEA